MKKNVLISVISEQEIKHETEKANFVTEGKFYDNNGNYFISYKESEVTGLDGTTTVLKITGNILTLMRFGKVNSHMIFEKNTKHLSCYETEYGTFTVGVLANDIDIKIDENGGDICIDYAIELNNSETGRTKLKLNIREVESNE